MSKPSDAPLTEPQRQLAAQWMPLLYKIVAKHTQSAADRADLVSGLQLALMRAARSFDPRRGFTFQALATRALNNAVIDVRRRQQTRRPEVNGLEDWQLERAVCLDYEPAPVRRDPKPETDLTPPAPPPSVADSARALLEDGVPFRDIATATGLRYWQVRQLAQQLGIKRLPGKPSRLGESLVAARLSRRQIMDATGLTSGAITRRIRTIRKTCKKSQRRKYRPAAYILQIMQAPNKPQRGRPAAIPERLWPEMRRRQLDGDTLQQLTLWLATQGIVVNIATVSRTMERIAAVAPNQARPALADIAAQLPEITDEEELSTIRKNMRDEAYNGIDWKQRHSAARLLVDLHKLRRAKQPPTLPPPASTATPSPETSPELTPEQEAELVRQQLGKRAQA